MKPKTGVAAEVHREFLLTTMEASTLIPGMRPEVWIMNSEQLPRALSVVAAFTSRGGAPAGDLQHWQCLMCGEQHEPQFTHCWRCGGARSAEELDRD